MFNFKPSDPMNNYNNSPENLFLRAVRPNLGLFIVGHKDERELIMDALRKAVHKSSAGWHPFQSMEEAYVFVEQYFAMERARAEMKSLAVRAMGEAFQPIRYEAFHVYEDSRRMDVMIVLTSGRLRLGAEVVYRRSIEQNAPHQVLEDLDKQLFWREVTRAAKAMSDDSQE